MKPNLKRPLWMRSRAFKNFLAGWLASSLAVPLFVMASDPGTAAPANAPSVAPAVEAPKNDTPAAGEIADVAEPEVQPSKEQQHDEYIDSLDGRDFKNSRQIQAARCEAKRRTDILEQDEIRDILKALDEEEIKLYVQKVKDAESLDDLSEAVDDLSQLADDRCDMIRKEKYGSDRHSRSSYSRSSSKDSDRISASRERARDLEKQMLTIASAFHLAAQKQVVLGKKEGEDGFAFADDTIDKALDVKCLDSRAKDRLEGYKRDIELTKCQAAAEMGSIAAIEVQMCTTQLVMQILPQVQSDCSTQTGGSMEQCITTLTALQKVKSFPSKMQEVDKQRQEQQQQMAQILQSALGAGQQPGTPGGLPMTSSSGSNFLWSGGSYGSTGPTASAPLPGVTPLPTM